MEKNEILIPETRGRKPKYRFNDMNLGETRTFTGVRTSTILACAKSYCNIAGLPWQFRCYTIDGVVHIVRVR